MTKYDVLGNLHNLIGAEFDYIAYINTPNSTQFLFKVEDNIIEGMIA